MARGIPTPTTLTAKQQDLVRIVRKEFGVRIEAYIVCVLAGYISDLSQLTESQQKRIHDLGERKGVTLPK